MDSRSCQMLWKKIISHDKFNTNNGDAALDQFNDVYLFFFKKNR